MSTMKTGAVLCVLFLAEVYGELCSTREWPSGDYKYLDCSWGCCGTAGDYGAYCCIPKPPKAEPNPRTRDFEITGTLLKGILSGAALLFSLCVGIGIFCCIRCHRRNQQRQPQPPPQCNYINKPGYTTDLDAGFTPQHHQMRPYGDGRFPGAFGNQNGIHSMNTTVPSQIQDNTTKDNPRHVSTYNNYDSEAQLSVVSNNYNNRTVPVHTDDMKSDYHPRDHPYRETPSPHITNKHSSFTLQL